MRRRLPRDPYIPTPGPSARPRRYPVTPIDEPALTDSGNAEYGGSRVERYTPQGRIDRVIEFPVTQPTSCCFGGRGLDTLYVTSATQRLEPDKLAQQPLAGRLFAVHLGVTGLPEAEYAG